MKASTLAVQFFFSSFVVATPAAVIPAEDMR
jgi:hypothetical protein